MLDFGGQNHLALVFFSALFISLLLVPVVMRLSARLNMFDFPDSRKVHTVAVSRLGGVAMFFGMALSLFLLGMLDRMMAGFLLGMCVVALTGFLDDTIGIRPVLKIVGEILAAALFILVGGAHLTEFGDLVGIGALHLGSWGPVITVFCMVGVMNALNLSDGLDGLASGIAAVAALSLGGFAYVGGAWVPTHIMLALLGATLGFLRYNSHPARLFMGDTGSLVLGYSLAAVAVMLTLPSATAGGMEAVTVGAVVALPIIDTLLVMLRRIRHGQNPFIPDKTHLHHRLMDLRFSHASVVAILYASSAAFGFLAWGMRGLPDRSQFAAVLLLGAIIYGTVFFMQRSELPWTLTGARSRRLTSLETVHTLIMATMEKTASLVAVVLMAGLLLPVLFVGSAPHAIGVGAIAAVGLFAPLLPWRTYPVHPGVTSGLTYLAAAVFLGVLHLQGGEQPWVARYLAVFSAGVMIWVLLKVKYRGHANIILLSPFELLTIVLSLIGALAVVPAVGVPELSAGTAIIVCIEAIVLLLAMKVIARRQARSALLFPVSILIVLLAIGIDGVVGWGNEFLESAGIMVAIALWGVNLFSNGRVAQPVVPPHALVPDPDPGRQLSPETPLSAFHAIPAPLADQLEDLALKGGKGNGGKDGLPMPGGPIIAPGESVG